MKLASAVILAVLVLVVSGVARASNGDEAKRVAVALVWANIHAEYGEVWASLHPRYQRVTTRSFWESCKRKQAKKWAEFWWFSVRAIDAYPDRVTLPLLGTIRVTAVPLIAEVAGREDRGSGTFVDTQLWVKVGSQWKGLWKPEEYRAYKAHRCPA